MTHSFTVADMTCGHCASRITTALRSRDATARVQVDLARQIVTVEGNAPGEEYAKAIRGAGYSPAAASV